MVHPCYKLYLVDRGEGSIQMNSGSYPLKAGHVYFLSGAQIRSQLCQKQMDLYWLHFNPESLYLRHLLAFTPAFISWRREEVEWMGEISQEIKSMFPPFTGSFQQPKEDRPISAFCRIQGGALLILSKVLEKLDPSTILKFQPEYERLKPALEYMQLNSTNNPSLKRVAQQVHLAPNYFHRQFKSIFGMTPFEYMLEERLNRARDLLSNTSLSVKEVAEKAGYENPLYFSRVFRSKTKRSPSGYRNIKRELHD